MTENYSNKVEPIKPSAYVLWKKYKKFIYTYVKHLGYPDVENAYSEAYLMIDHALKTFDETRGSKFKSWVMTILMQRLYSFCFTTKYLIRRPPAFETRPEGFNISIDRINTTANDEDFPIQWESKRDLPDVETDKKIIKEIVKGALEKLSPEYKYLIESVYGINTEKKTYQQLADEYGCSSQNIHTKIKFAKRRLYKYIISKDINIGEVLDYET